MPDAIEGMAFAASDLVPRVEHDAHERHRATRDDLDELAEAELSRRRTASAPRSPCSASRTSRPAPRRSRRSELGARPRVVARSASTSSQPPMGSDSCRRSRRGPGVPTIGRVAPAAAQHAHGLVDGDAGGARVALQGRSEREQLRAAAPQPRHGAARDATTAPACRAIHRRSTDGFTRSARAISPDPRPCSRLTASR